MKAVFEPVRDLYKDDPEEVGTCFARCEEHEAEYWAVYIEHEPGYSLHVKDYNTRAEAEEMVNALNHALNP